jgi:hypothetical protein
MAYFVVLIEGWSRRYGRWEALIVGCGLGSGGWRRRRRDSAQWPVDAQPRAATHTQPAES